MRAGSPIWWTPPDALPGKITGKIHPIAGWMKSLNNSTGEVLCEFMRPGSRQIYHKLLQVHEIRERKIL